MLKDLIVNKNVQSRIWLIISSNFKYVQLNHFQPKLKVVKWIFCGQKLTKNKFCTHEIALLTTEQKILQLLMIASRQNPNQDWKLWDFYCTLACHFGRCCKESILPKSYLDLGKCTVWHNWTCILVPKYDLKRDNWHSEMGGGSTLRKILFVTISRSSFLNTN